MDWIFTSLNWYSYVFLLGLIFFPLTKKIFGRFSFDFGYPFAKALAIILVSYTTFVLGLLKVLPFNRNSLFLIIGICVLINYFIYRHKKIKSHRHTVFVIIFEEIIFLLSFLFWTFVRSQEPAIHGLEKFMDYGFINSILKSDFFPPKDIWYSPEPINYYYFGHLSGAFIIKLTGILPAIGYNLILSTLFGLGITQIFSLISNIILFYNQKIKKLTLIIFGLIGAFLVNLGGNLHTIYLFTSGYPNEQPIPFWKIFGDYSPEKYWYPNATRFIPYTIHEFPSYSYVVADLHGHVFDIPFVLLTIAILFLMFTSIHKVKSIHKKIFNFQFSIFNQLSNFKFLISKLFSDHFSLVTIFLGFLTAIHYMTNAFDGPIYILLVSLFLYVFFRMTWRFIYYFLTLIVSFLFFSFPFSAYFSPFITGIGVNCSAEFLTRIGKIGPFIFEAGKCQASPFWMLFILWGFFWISFLLLYIVYRIKKPTTNHQPPVINFLLILFSFGTFLIIIPEFFYIKDIYPAHFRANTMFKLGYQAYIMMGIASIVTIAIIKSIKKTIVSQAMSKCWFIFAVLVAIYPFLSIPAYYGHLDRKPELDGSVWLIKDRPEDKEIIDYLNNNVKGQPVILEAQGDSYTDYERISAYTGLPTVAGWWVHEWLWRGSSDVIGKRIPEVSSLYQSKDLNETKFLINKYGIKYVIVSGLEKEKYSELQEAKFTKIGRLIFRSTNGLGAIYQIK